MQPELCGFKVLTFDVYGTLIDWETGMIEALRPLTDRLRRTPGRDGILETHAFHESTAQPWTPTRTWAMTFLDCGRPNNPIDTIVLRIKEAVRSLSANGFADVCSRTQFNQWPPFGA
ncbi:MAG: hypothetical protein OXI81_05570 [Paracoccaceae bacterium]|nr:hypothetical protein [Paracoccaceae bacterium]MDE2915053.1 hypothetical protein [Paracoccaceae bacterium]